MRRVKGYGAGRLGGGKAAARVATDEGDDFAREGMDEGAEGACSALDVLLRW